MMARFHYPLSTSYGTTRVFLALSSHPYTVLIAQLHFMLCFSVAYGEKKFQVESYLPIPNDFSSPIDLKGCQKPQRHHVKEAFNRALLHRFRYAAWELTS